MPVGQATQNKTISMRGDYLYTGLAVGFLLVFACTAVMSQGVAESNTVKTLNDKVAKTLKARDFEKEGWHPDPKNVRIRSSGVAAYHGYLKVFYTDGVKEWLNPTPSKKPRGLKNNEMIVALEYASPQKDSDPERINTMVRWNGTANQAGPYDGWFWSVADVKDGQIIETRSGFGMGRCISCHAAADNESMVFLGKPDETAASNQSEKLDANGWKPGDKELEWADPKPAERHLIKPLEEKNASDKERIDAFLGYFKLDNMEPVKINDFERFPAKSNDHVIARYHPVRPHTQDHAQFITSDQCVGCHSASQLIPNTRPNMWYPEPEPELNLIEGVETVDADAHRNFSPYGEWSASLNGLSGRDPVWHAQVAFERNLRPELRDFTDTACFSCHGPMATRQLAIDKGKLFSIDMFYETDGENAKYGALARDGVSCAVCHQVSAKDLGVDPAFDPDHPPGKHLEPKDLNSYTASFTVEPFAAKNAYWGPYKEGELTETKVSSLVMDKSIGQRARYGPQIHESKLCGSCHTVIVPALPVGYKLPSDVKDPFHDPEVPLSFEQTTYFEWRNSSYENEIHPGNPAAITCQGCHMAYHTAENSDEGRRIVNTLSNRYPPVDGRTLDPAITYTKKDTIYRHVLLGINYFVFEMYEQFKGRLIGTTTEEDDPDVPQGTVDPTINARDWIENHAKKITAEVRITDIEDRKKIGDKEFLEVEVEVTNLAGHKFPTGAGFRRAFLKFEVLDQSGNTLWASGRFDPLGVLLKADGKPLDSESTHIPHVSQPHHQIITREDQAQIYETRALDSTHRLQTTVLGIYCEYKDNRILPHGFKSLKATPGGEGKDKPWRNFYSMAPRLVGQKKVQPDEVNLEPDPEYKAPRQATHFEHSPDCIKGKSKRDADNKTGGKAPEPEYEVVYDSDYFENADRGQDRIRYRVPLNDRTRDWAKVTAQLYYQTIPPYYLADRFAALSKDKPGEPLNERDLKDLKRLVYMTSHLNLQEGALTEGWSLKVGNLAEKMKGEEGDDRFDDRFDVPKRLKEHYTYLKLP